MSHATVLVVLNEEENLNDVLAPFEECPEHDSVYCEFYDETENLKEEYEKLSSKEKEETCFEDFCFEEGYDESITDEGKFGSYGNPNAKWDWWVIGGRWSNFLKLKKDIEYPEDIIINGNDKYTGSEIYCSGARKCDIDFEGMKIEQISDLKKKYSEFKKKEEENSKDLNISAYLYDIRFIKEEKRYETEEEFIKRSSCNLFYSILKNGEWNSLGELLWFGISLDEKPEEYSKVEQKLIDSIEENQMLILVDYHI